MTAPTDRASDPLQVALEGRGACHPVVVDVPGDVPRGARIARALPLPAEGVRGHVQPDHPLEDRAAVDDGRALEADPPVDLDAHEVQVRTVRVDPGLPPAPVDDFADRQAAALQGTFGIGPVEG